MHFFQAKALILLPDSIAVHNVTSGDVLWQHSLEIEGENRPFITRDIAGCVDLDDYDWQKMDHDATIQIYDTQSGKHISDMRIEMLDISRLWYHGLFARGSYLCYFDMFNLCVHKVIGREVKEHDISFPVEHLVKTSNNFSSSDNHKKISNAFRFEKCLGFVAKSNVLLLNFRSNESGNLIVSLDLDAYLSANNENERNSSFSLPLDAHCSLGRPGDQNWQPVYQTDTINGCVDIVGIMRLSLTQCEKRAQILENYFFVTELDLPK